MQFALDALQQLVSSLSDMADRLFEGEERAALEVVRVVMPAVWSWLREVEMPLMRHHATLAARFIELLTRYPFAAKTWRRDAWECFLRPEFFVEVPLEALGSWQHVVNRALFLGDKDGGKNGSFSLLVGGKTGLSSTNMFASKEAEYVQQAALWRRISFAIYAGEEARYRTHTATLRQLFVEAFRTCDASPLVRGELFFHLRVLMLRMPPATLQSLWPLVVTELMRVFSETPAIMTSGSALQQQRNTHLLLEALKALDLVLVLLPDQFQPYEWIFLHNLLDKCVVGSGGEPDDGSAILPASRSDAKRPLVTMSRVRSLRALDAHIHGLRAFVRANRTFAAAAVDHEFIEAIMDADFASIGTLN